MKARGQMDKQIKEILKLVINKDDSKENRVGGFITFETYEFEEALKKQISQARQEGRREALEEIKNIARTETEIGYHEPYFILTKKEFKSLEQKEQE